MHYSCTHITTVGVEGLIGVSEMIEQEVMSLAESSAAAKTTSDETDTQQHASDILDSSKFDLKLDKSNILMLGPTGSGECDSVQ